MIPESFIQDLLARVDIVDVVGRYVQLRKGGVNLLGLCPFHNEKSPSFTVSPSKQFYHCFGCGAHGSAIGFLMEHTGASFPETVRTLAASVGMTVPEENRSPRQQAESARRKAEVSRHTQLLDLTQAHYQQQLKASPAARRYLKQRGLTEEMAAHFGLGWSGTDRHGLSQLFPSYDDPALVEVGLVIAAEDGRRYDRFRERIMFPIRNARGSLVGFGGRIIDKGEPKYLNSPETPLFSKGQELYGLWEARQAIRQEGQIIVVEGYMDVVGLAQQGIANAVATLGTATTPDHVKKLLRASDKVIFSFDGDSAGKRAAWRALQACLPVLRDDIAIRFLFLPTAHDPDSYVREFGEQAFRACLGEATALSRFLLDELASRHMMGEAEGRASCLHEAKPLLAAIPECALRVQIEREMAKLVQLTPEEMAKILSQVPVNPYGQPQSPAGETAPSGAFRLRGADLESNDSMPSQPFYESMDERVSYRDPGDFSIPARGLQTRAIGSSQPLSNARQGAGGYASGGRTNKFGGFSGRRAMPSLAKRLLILLLTHPELVDAMGDQQLEVIDHDPQLSLVRELIMLAQSSGARHVGALLAAVEPDSDLAILLKGLRADLLAQEDLPNPQAEWDDALRLIEFAAARQESEVLAAGGLTTPEDRARYLALNQRLKTLKGSGTR